MTTNFFPFFKYILNSYYAPSIINCCYKLNFAPLPTKYVLKSKPILPMECGLIQKQSICRYSQVKMRSAGQVLIQYDYCPYRKREIWTWTHRKEKMTQVKETKTRIKPCDNRGRDRSKAVANPASLRIDGHHQKLAKEGVLPYTFQRKHGPTDPLTLEFFFPEV